MKEKEHLPYNPLTRKDLEEFLKDLETNSSETDRYFGLQGGRQAQKMFQEAMKHEVKRQIQEESAKLLAWQRAQPKQYRRKFKFDDATRNNDAHEKVHKK